MILFDDSFKGDDIRKLVDFGESLGIPVKYVCLVDYSNSRGAMDMGLTPELLPGYKPAGSRACTSTRCSRPDLDVLWVVGANPLEERVAAEGRLPRGAGYVPHRDGGAGRRRPAGRLARTKRTAPLPTSPAKCSG